jgi:hypothetical protein
MDDVRRIVKAPTKIRQINTVRLILRVMPLTNTHCRRIRAPRILVDPKTIYGVANYEVVPQTEQPWQDGIDSVVRVH